MPGNDTPFMLFWSMLNPLSLSSSLEQIAWKKDFVLFSRKPSSMPWHVFCMPCKICRLSALLSGTKMSINELKSSWKLKNEKKNYNNFLTFYFIISFEIFIFNFEIEIGRAFRTEMGIPIAKNSKKSRSQKIPKKSRSQKSES